MASSKTPATSPSVAGWRVWQSDTGRFWATRTKPFSHTAEYAGAARTVDGDTLPQLYCSIARQESTAKCIKPR
ncbi:hypothetical protein [Nonomuraea sp. JJY05]|jgi:hypothetical protein|uniref:hypothetical protein n=1 Tax=Nonomuraea sp. JJY05 TaxID=3350255 RepID=UPI00373FB7E0